jgi:hypothetical protein
MTFFVRVKPTDMRSAPSNKAGAPEINSKVERFIRPAKGILEQILAGV